MEVIIQKNSMAPQYESPGRNKLGREGVPHISAMAARSGDSWTGGRKPSSQWWEKAKGALHRVKYPS
jgi:hypothetical protein